MLILLEVTTALLLIVSVIACAYVRYLAIQNEHLSEGINRISADLETVKAKQRVYEKRLQGMERPDKIIFLNPEKEVEYGSF